MSNSGVGDADEGEGEGDVSMADLIKVANGQSHEIDAAIQEVQLLEDDLELEELRRRARALLGHDAQAASSPVPSELSTASADHASWRSVVARHEQASSSIDELLTPEMRTEFERDWQAGLLELGDRVESERMEALIRSAKTRVVGAMVGPFGLGACPTLSLKISNFPAMEPS